jgi:hypothetical protein
MSKINSRTAAFATKILSLGFAATGRLGPRWADAGGATRSGRSPRSSPLRGPRLCRSGVVFCRRCYVDDEAEPAVRARAR